MLHIKCHVNVDEMPSFIVRDGKVGALVWQIWHESLSTL